MGNALSRAAGTLLCPRAVTSLAADPELLELAGAALAEHDGGCRGGCDRGGDERGAFVPLAEELLRVASDVRAALGGEEEQDEYEALGLSVSGAMAQERNVLCATRFSTMPLLVHGGDEHSAHSSRWVLVCWREGRASVQSSCGQKLSNEHVVPSDDI